MSLPLPGERDKICVLPQRISPFMKLIGTITSPYVRKVRIVLAEKKFECDFAIDMPSQPDSAVPALNPLARIPVLVLDDGSPLYDSRVIAEYLDNMSPNSKLMPGTNRERTEIKRWEALADGVCDAAVTVVMERRRPAGEQSSSWIERNLKVIGHSLAVLAEQLGEKPYCTGNHMTLADIATGSALGYLAFRLPEIDWRTAHPELDRLYERLMQRTSFIDTVPV